MTDRLTPDTVRRMALIYMSTFGQVFKEGAINADGHPITLSDYFTTCLLPSAQFQTHLQSSERLQKLASLSDLGSVELMELLVWLEGLPTVVRTSLEREIEQNTGYRRFYQLPAVEALFKDSLVPATDYEPTIFFWGDDEEGVTGVATQYIVHTETALAQLVDRSPYLYPGTGDQIVRFLKQHQYLTFPFEWDAEAFAIDTTRGSSQGSFWKQGLHASRSYSLERGCRHAAVLTFEESQVFKGLMRQLSTREEVLHVTSHTGEMVLVTTDVPMSVAELSAQLANRD